MDLRTAYFLVVGILSLIAGIIVLKRRFSKKKTIVKVIGILLVLLALFSLLLGFNSWESAHCGWGCQSDILYNPLQT